MSKRAIIVVDLQNDYLAAGRFPLVGIDAALENAARVVDAARRSGDLVINVRHESAADGPFFAVGTEGAERDLEFRGEVVSADKVHAAYMSALAFGYGRVVSTEEYLAN
ncbi:MULTISPECIES: isochorismatase family protein [Neorhizobium]|jgi:hypothetical protein|uniref:isochorismatase family protein n=1 Tax=Neorhizobium TaxID=1525371 RepID=UPI000CFA6E2E|nr:MULTISPECIES: isochorismatase family protein [Neorhizobium]